MSDDATTITAKPVDSADPPIEALLEEMRQAQAEMERLSARVTKLLGDSKKLPKGKAGRGSE